LGYDFLSGLHRSGLDSAFVLVTGFSGFFVWILDCRSGWIAARSATSWIFWMPPHNATPGFYLPGLHVPTAYRTRSGLQFWIGLRSSCGYGFWVRYVPPLRSRSACHVLLPTCATLRCLPGLPFCLDYLRFTCLPRALLPGLRTAFYARRTPHWITLPYTYGWVAACTCILHLRFLQFRLPHIPATPTCGSHAGWILRVWFAAVLLDSRFWFWFLPACLPPARFTATYHGWITSFCHTHAATAPGLRRCAGCTPPGSRIAHTATRLVLVLRLPYLWIGSAALTVYGLPRHTCLPVHIHFLVLFARFGSCILRFTDYLQFTHTLPLPPPLPACARLRSLPTLHAVCSWITGSGFWIYAVCRFWFCRSGSRYLPDSAGFRIAGSCGFAFTCGSHTVTRTHAFGSPTHTFAFCYAPPHRLDYRLHPRLLPLDGLVGSGLPFTPDSACRSTPGFTWFWVRAPFTCTCRSLRLPFRCLPRFPHRLRLHSPTDLDFATFTFTRLHLLLGLRSFSRAHTAHVRSTCTTLPLHCCGYVRTRTPPGSGYVGLPFWVLDDFHCVLRISLPHRYGYAAWIGLRFTAVRGCRRSGYVPRLDLRWIWFCVGCHVLVLRATAHLRSLRLLHHRTFGWFTPFAFSGFCRIRTVLVACLPVLPGFCWIPLHVLHHTTPRGLRWIAFWIPLPLLPFWMPFYGLPFRSVLDCVAVPPHCRWLRWIADSYTTHHRDLRVHLRVAADCVLRTPRVLPLILRLPGFCVAYVAVVLRCYTHVAVGCVAILIPLHVTAVPHLHAARVCTFVAGYTFTLPHLRCGCRCLPLPHRVYDLPAAFAGAHARSRTRVAFAFAVLPLPRITVRYHWIRSADYGAFTLVEFRYVPVLRCSALFFVEFTLLPLSAFLDSTLPACGFAVCYTPHVADSPVGFYPD